MKLKSPELSDSVKAALHNHKPVLALESTLISHGLPWPVNFQTAQKLESLASDQGVTPATIALIDGSPRVGLSDGDLEMLARKGPDCRKLSSFDLPWARAKKETATTTVAGTMKIASAAGIQVFSTGGIGGVHRDYHLLPDISHDLEYLNKVPMIVVSAGPKAILDLPATKEYLETKGVLTIGYQCDEMPAFYYRNSGLRLDYRVEHPKEIAEIFQHMSGQSLLVMNPVPEACELDRGLVEASVEKSMETARQSGIFGKALTPFLLRQMNLITKGKSVDCNLALIQNNVDLGAKIAKEISRFSVT